eukprot:6198886-Pleurochrysis_carterae.AAC.4
MAAAPTVADAVKRYLELTAELKEQNKVVKEIRQNVADLKTVIIGYMEQQELEVCKVTHGGKSGELALRHVVRSRTLKEADAVNAMSSWFEREMHVPGVQSAKRAEDLWKKLQDSRESTEVLDLSLRKLK